MTRRIWPSPRMRLPGRRSCVSCNTFRCHQDCHSTTSKPGATMDRSLHSFAHRTEMTDDRHLRTEIPRILRDGDPGPQSAAQILDRLTGRGLVVDRTEVQHACYLLEREHAITRRVRDGVVQWTACLSASASTSSPVKDDRDAS